MKATRRKFLQQFAAGSAWAALALGGRGWADPVQEGEVAAHDRPITALGEDFWEEVRRQYDLPTQIWLNTGTLGLMAKPVVSEVMLRLQLLTQGRYAIDEEPRTAVARLMGAPVSTISMTHNTTEGINIIAQGLRLKRGDEVIMTDHEHVGNALPWLNRMRTTGIKIKVLQPANTVAENMNRLNALITKRTRVIALPHITCTVGHLLPAKAIATLAREKGIFSFFDGAHGPGMAFPDMIDLGCDAYAACGHKWLGGPAGTGMLYLRQDALSKVEARMVGAYSDLGWEISATKQSLTGLVNTAHRYDYGTQNVALHMGVKAAVEFMEWVGVTKVQERVHFLGDYLQQKLLERSYIEMLTPQEAESRSAMIGFKVKGKSMQELEQSDLAKSFRVRFVAESGLNSVRVSPHIHTLPSDLDRFVTELDRYMQI